MDHKNKKNIIDLKELMIGYRTQHTRTSFAYGPINLSIRSGDMIALIGRNGIGKSSLLRTIAQLQNPLGGNVRLFGKESDRYGRRELAQIISFVSTEIVSIQNLKVYDLISLGRAPYTNWLGKLMDHDHSGIQSALDKVKIPHLGAKFMHQLSDGERQKVMIARALAQDTPVIILDEPTAFLDLPSRYEVLRLLNELSIREGKTILFSTHDLDIAIHEADIIWLMISEGITEGAPEDLLFKKQFHKLFLNSCLEYDQQSDGFRLQKGSQKSIGLKGTEESVHFTGKALRRIGFQVDGTNKGIGRIEIVSEGGKIVWILDTGAEKQVFQSIYELTDYLKYNCK
ncbi:MAG: ABC transporter ATP-binding protein [Bacteroidales bacterium]|nr:ABC transporter ATP-binding protein [Bacteroidales bacterium]